MKFQRFTLEKQTNFDLNYNVCSSSYKRLEVFEMGLFDGLQIEKLIQDGFNNPEYHLNVLISRVLEK